QLPTEWMRVIGQDEASELAGQAVGRGGLYFPGGQQVRPALLCADMLADPAIHRLDASVDCVRRGPDGCWQAMDAGGGLLASAQVVVLASARGVPDLLARSGI